MFKGNTGSWNATRMVSGLWIENRTGAPISSAIVDEVERIGAHMKPIREFFWPILDPMPESTATQLRENRDRELAAIRSATWILPETMEHARQLNSAENERKQGAETKASLYLAVISAIVPIMGSLRDGLLPAVFEFPGRRV